MSTPAGYYPHPQIPSTLVYWDGTAWTQNIINIPPTPALPAAAKKTRIYWGNLFRFRFWQFTLGTGFLFGIVLAFLGLSGAVLTIVFILVAALTGWYWLTVQMACRHCGTILRVTRITGQQQVCHKCQQPTDS